MVAVSHQESSWMQGIWGGAGGKLVFKQTVVELQDTGLPCV